MDDASDFDFMHPKDIFLNAIGFLLSLAVIGLVEASDMEDKMMIEIAAGLDAICELTPMLFKMRVCNELANSMQGDPDKPSSCQPDDWSPEGKKRFQSGMKILASVATVGVIVTGGGEFGVVGLALVNIIVKTIALWRAFKLPTPACCVKCQEKLEKNFDIQDRVVHPA